MDGFLEMVGFFSCVAMAGGIIIGAVCLVCATLDNRDGLKHLRGQVNECSRDKYVFSLADRIIALEMAATKKKGR